mmetsp:Transcript_27985/g.54835  ORF Transcript_27985/g.54835 Transcript_27985/m.54835 type:complete len:130 (+) Transcript_27985:201-590(+)
MDLFDWSFVSLRSHCTSLSFKTGLALFFCVSFSFFSFSLSHPSVFSPGLLSLFVPPLVARRGDATIRDLDLQTALRDSGGVPSFSQTAKRQKCISIRNLERERLIGWMIGRLDIGKGEEEKEATVYASS